MTGSVLVTVDSQFRLLLRSKRHKIPWLRDRAEAKCVIEVVGRGLVRIWALEQWASVMESSPEDAEADLLSLRPRPHDPGTKVSGHFFGLARRKKNAGLPLHEIHLPDAAIFALFEQGEGPMTVSQGGGTNSGKVLLIVCSEFAELIGQYLL